MSAEWRKYGSVIGSRPIDLHLKGLERLGAKFQIQAGYVRATAKKLQGAEVFLGGRVGSTDRLGGLGLGGRAADEERCRREEREILAQLRLHGQSGRDDDADDDPFRRVIEPQNRRSALRPVGRRFQLNALAG